MPINHQNGDPDGCALCDALLLALKALDPSIVRHEAPSTCSFRAERHASFAFAYHYKTDSHLQIYFRAASEDRFDLPPSTLITRRKSISSEWAKLFPESLRLDTQAQIEPVTTFLFDSSYQLAAVQKRSKRGGHRPDYVPPEELLIGNTLSEGSPFRITVNRYERSPAARARCISHHGSRCIVCGFDFGLVLIGTNGSGKTSFLEVLSLLSASCNAQMSSRISDLGGIGDIITRDKATAIEIDVSSPVQGGLPLDFAFIHMAFSMQLEGSDLGTIALDWIEVKR